MNRLSPVALLATCFALTFATPLRADQLGHFTFTDHGSTISIDRYTHYIKGDVVIPPYINGKPVTEIGDLAFWGCRRITSVSVPDSVKQIGRGAFHRCEKMQSVNVPSGITNIKDETFQYCRALKAISLPDSIESIGARAFRDCTTLKSFTFPAKLTVLSEEMLAGCQGVSEITIPPRITRMEAEAIGGTGIKRIQIPQTVEFLGARQFYACRSLRHVEFQKNITEVGDFMFAFCSSLREVNLPKSVRRIGIGAFRASAITDPQLDGVEQIDRGAFRACSNLTHVRIPKSVARIGNEAFNRCRHLSTAYFEGNAPEMGDAVFSEISRDFVVFAEERSRGFTIPRWEGYKLSTPRAEIVVRDSSGSLLDANGQTVSKFGIVHVGSKSPAKTFVIENVGTRPLTLLGGGLDGVGFLEFPIGKFASGTLAPGARTTIKVAFEPLISGKRKVTLKIRSSDEDEGLFSIPLVGLGIEDL